MQRASSFVKGWGSSSTESLRSMRWKKSKTRRKPSRAKRSKEMRARSKKKTKRKLSFSNLRLNVSDRWAEICDYLFCSRFTLF